MEERVFNGDTIEIIAKFLDPKDMWNLSSIKLRKKKRLFKYFKQSIIRKIDNWFRNYFKQDYDEFRKIMSNNEIVIGGSFVLQMILGEFWEESDIDIFTFSERQGGDIYPTYSALENFLFRNHLPLLREDENPNIRYTSTMKRFVHTIREYKINTEEVGKQDHFTKIQVLGCYKNSEKKEGNLLRTLQSYTDINVCKNVFYYDQKGIHISFISPESIYKKNAISIVHPWGWDDDVCSKLARYEKYKSRGFSFNEKRVQRAKDSHDRKIKELHLQTKYSCRCGKWVVPI